MLSIFALSQLVATAAPPMHVIPLDGYHPAVGYSPLFANSFASAPNVGFDIKSLESLVGAPFEKKWDKLVTKKVVSRVPWESDYWAVYRDGINFKWDGAQTLSPVEKYAKAFGVDAKMLADNVSRKSGILGQSWSKACKTQNDCEGGAACGIRHGETEGRCIPSWFGICHAWAPAAILEKEPKCPVEYNGVRFEPLELKALMSQIYDSSSVPTVFTGRRCDVEKPELDKNGRPIPDECRDVSPEFFHLVITNMIGKFDRSFVADVDYSGEVWNQPVRGYQILDQHKMSTADAMKKYFPEANSETYTFNPNAKELLYVDVAFSYIVESIENISGQADRYTRTKTYEYLLELDGNGDIIGGEWVGRSKTNHVDFIWAPVRTPSQDAVVLGGISYKEIKNLIELSQTSPLCFDASTFR